MLLKDCATIKGGKRLPKGQTLQEERNSHPYIRVKDMQKRYVSLSNDYEYVSDNIFPSISRYTVNTDDIILSIVGTVGLVAIVDKSLNNANLTENCVKLVNIKNFLSKYVYYYLISESGQAQIQAGIVGSTQPKFPLYNIEKIEIPDTSMSEQQHIVDILGSIDDSIENNEKIAANLEDYAVSKYQEITRDISDFITLGEVVDIYDSKRKPLSSRERESRKGNYRYYGATGVLDYVDDYLFDGEYVLLAEDGTVIDENGYPIVQLVTGQFWVNNHAHIMQATAGYTNYSLYVALKKLSVNTAVTGAVQLKINQANLCALELPQIDENKLSEFNQEIEPLFLKIIQIRAEVGKLNEIKQLYLHKFFG